MSFRLPSFVLFYIGNELQGLERRDGRDLLSFRTSVYNKTYEISDSTRKEIAKHCYHAITPLIKAERKAMEIEGKEVSFEFLSVKRKMY